MKKSIFLLLLSVLFISFSTKAQTDSSVSDAEKFGDLMCDCINTLMDDMHLEIKRMIINSEVLGSEEAQKRFATYIEEHPEESEKIMSDAKKLQNFDQSIADIEVCNELNEFTKKGNFKENEAELEKEVEDFLENKSKCVYAFIFYSMGKK
ncbi:hypothetical protein [Mesoflavibacter sp. CH_XMU1422-2]|uniref:hypothetical protein n=1 Tax=Mesoflavibacter sp. CH_XMU1422-2 TaxID=3107770 RepID=UPI00300B81F3